MPRSVGSRDSIRQSLVNQTQENYSHKDDSGQFKTYFREGLKLSLWKCGKGVHLADFIPYAVGPKHPKVVLGKMQAGQYEYVLDLWVHFDVGPLRDQFVCLLKTFKQPCYICEEADMKRRQGETEEILEMYRAKRRTVYNIICYDTDAEEAKGIQLFEIAHFFMERHILALAKTARGDGYVIFSDPDSGQSIAFERTGVGAENTKYEGHKFEPRPQGFTISDQVLSSAYQLDDIIHIPTYEEVKEVWLSSMEAGGVVSSPSPAAASPGLSRRNPPASRTTSPSRPAPASLAAPAATVLPGQCPAGGVFGRDIDQFAEQCGQCVSWNDCCREAERLEQGGAPPSVNNLPSPASPRRPAPGQQPPTAASPGLQRRRPR